MDLRDRRELANGFGDGFSKAIEFVATPVLFGFFGRFLDGRFGTAPVFMLLLGLVAVVAMFLKMYYAYVEAMKAEDKRRPWGHA